MAIPVAMPKAGITVESCILTKWNVKVGDVERNTLTEFNSHNTKLLTVAETKEKIASLQYIQDELKK